MFIFLRSLLVVIESSLAIVRSFVGSATKERAVAAILIRDGNSLLLHEPADSPIREESFSHIFIGQRWSHMVMMMSFDD